MTGNIHKLLTQTLHKKVQNFHVLHTKWSYIYNLIFNKQTLCFKMTLTKLKKNYRSKHVPSKCKEQSIRHKSCSISSVMGLTGYVSQRLSSKVLSCWSCVESWHLSLLCKKLLGLRGCPCNPHNGCSNRDLMEVLYSPVSCSKSDLHIVIGLTPFWISSVGNHQNYVLTTHVQN